MTHLGTSNTVAEAQGSDDHHGTLSSKRQADDGAASRKTAVTECLTLPSEESSESSGNETRAPPSRQGDNEKYNDSLDSGNDSDDREKGNNTTNARDSFLEDPEVQQGRCNPDPLGDEYHCQQASQSSVVVVVPKVVRVSPLPQSRRTSDRILTGHSNNNVIRPKPVKQRIAVNAAVLNHYQNQSTDYRAPEAATKTTTATMAQQPGSRRHLEERRRKDEEKAEAKRRRDAQVDFQSTPASQRLSSMNNRMTMDPNGQQPPQHQTHITQATQQLHLNPHHPVPNTPSGYTNGSRAHMAPQQPQLPRLHPHPHHPTAMRPNNGNSPAPSQTSSKGKKPHSLGGSLSNGTNTNSDHSTPSIHPAPLFQRLVSEEVQEIKAYARIIEAQNRRLAELERSHADLEARLEVQSNRRMDLERTLEERERRWAEQIQELEEERDQWKGNVQQEQSKNARLREQIGRKDQDIHRMLQRKYDTKRDGRSKRPTDRKTTLPQTAAAVNGEPKPMLFSPQQILAASGSANDIRERNVSNSLQDFFGI